ncbi:PREDICTED: uncharacterized protein LOC104591912 [Nelumbo nucifera]|uniref:Uncharacterized protein LOC104591912 n=1 Tax=Nelumbo nucifera TaxID=4432 RepID=A0A1U7Z9V8_NELNU|nr:PREDICTED: uncharacterized protein LOC104591912 [Nelumbo nucifera]
MEVHSHVRSSAMGKRLWNLLRIAYFMMRKGFVSKRKLIMDMNLMMKRGKLLGKSLLGNLNLMFQFHHHHHSKDLLRTRAGFGFGLHEYEFSCSNSPNPVFFHVSNKRRNHLFPHFPCINPPPPTPPRVPDDDQQEANNEVAKAVVVLSKKDYSPDYYNSSLYSFRFDTSSDLAPGEQLSPFLSPFSIRISNYSSESEGDGGNMKVDDEAEEFIRRFYEQLRMQNRTQLLQYQEMLTGARETTTQ